MSIAEHLLELFEKKARVTHPEDFKPAPSKEEILTFTQQHNIELREDHLQFLMKYGGGWLETEMVGGENSFEDFKEYYLEADETTIKLNKEQITPLGSTYFGPDGNSDIIAINNKTGQLGFFNETIKDVNYSNIQSLLFNYFIRCRGKYHYFDNELDGLFTSSQEANEYRKENEAYKLKGIYIAYEDFYYKNHQLFSLVSPPYGDRAYTEYSGGILDLIE